MIQEMKYICTIWEEKNFTRAAEKLFISQPALSATVKRVETSLDIQIFDRSTKPISLTTEGEKYIQSAKQILKILDDMDVYFSQLNQLQAGKVVIGTSEFFSSYIMPEIIRDFKKIYKQIEIEIQVGTPIGRNKMLREEAIDIIISVENELDAGTMDIKNWKQEHLLLAISKDKPITNSLKRSRFTIADIKNKEHLRNQEKKISISHFSKEPFLSLRKQNDIYNRTLKICNQAGFEPIFDTGASLHMTAYHMVRAGLGIAFVRESLIDNVLDTNDIYLYDIDSPEVYRDICIAFKKNKGLSSAVQTFYEFLSTT